MHQIYIPSRATDQLRTFALMERLFAEVPVYHLVVDMSREAVKVAAECLLNKNGQNI